VSDQKRLNGLATFIYLARERASHIHIPRLQCLSDEHKLQCLSVQSVTPVVHIDLRRVFVNNILANITAKNCSFNALFEPETFRILKFKGK
jgi:hypothetical protein